MDFLRIKFQFMINGEIEEDLSEVHPSIHVPQKSAHVMFSGILHEVFGVTSYFPPLREQPDDVDIDAVVTLVRA